jgi:hypothetical protein
VDSGERCASGGPPSEDGRHRAPSGPRPALRRPPWARDLPSPTRAAGAKRQNHGLPPAASLIELAELLPAPSPASDPGFHEGLSLASECLFAARREIQRSVRTPISVRDTSIFLDLLRRVSDLLAADGVADDLGRPVTGRELADAGYRLLDTAHEYYILAEHFYSGEVQAARAMRPSDVTEAEIAAVARKAASLKLAVLKYLNKVGEALREKAAPANLATHRPESSSLCADAPPLRAM